MSTQEKGGRRGSWGCCRRMLGPCVAGLLEGAEVASSTAGSQEKEREGTAEGRVPREPGLRRGTWGPMPQEPAVDMALKAHQSLRKHFTEALAGESPGPSQALLSAPPEVPPGKHLCCAGHDTLGGAPRVVPERCPAEVSLAAGLTLSLSPRPGGESSLPPRLLRAEARGCIWGSRKAEARPCPLVLLLPQPWPLPIHLALPGRGTSTKYQAKHHQVDPRLPASENKAPVPRPDQRRHTSCASRTQRSALPGPKTPIL